MRPNRSPLRRLLRGAFPAVAGVALACGGTQKGEFRAEASGGAQAEFDGGAVFCNEDRGYGPVLLIRLEGDGLNASFDRTDASLPAARAYPFVPYGEAGPAEGFHATVGGLPGDDAELALSPRGGEIRFEQASAQRLRGRFLLRGVLETTAEAGGAAPRADSAAVLQGTFTARGVPCDSIPD